MERSKFVTPPEAGEMMMCSALHVRRLIQSGQLPAYYVGNRAYIPRTAVEAYIQSMFKHRDEGNKNAREI